MPEHDNRVPATPAPSQPAGAREAAESAAIEWLDEESEYPTHSEYMADVRGLASVIQRHAAQQTAAKDAELAQLTQEANLWHDEREAELELRQAAERERDSLREALRRCQRFFAERPGWDEARELEDVCDAALKAGKDGQQ